MAREIGCGDNPTVTEIENIDWVKASLWTKKGRRLYLNGFGPRSASRYVDLDTGELEGGYVSSYEVSVNDEAGTLTVSGRDRKIVVDLDVETDDEADTTDSTDDESATSVPSFDDLKDAQTGDSIVYFEAGEGPADGHTADLVNVVQTDETTIRLEYIGLNIAGTLFAWVFERQEDGSVVVHRERAEADADGITGWTRMDRDLRTLRLAGPSDRPRVTPDELDGRWRDADSLRSSDPAFADEPTDGKQWRFMARRSRKYHSEGDSATEDGSDGDDGGGGTGMGVKGLPEGSKENDIRHTMEARELKHMPMMMPERDWEHDYWGHVCPVCGEELKAGEDADYDPDTLHDEDDDGEYDPDTYVGGVGDFHVKHLSREEYEYTREIQRDEERDWDRLYHAEQTQKMNMALAGDAAGRHGAPPDLPAESALYGLEHDLDGADDE